MRSTGKNEYLLLQVWDNTKAVVIRTRNSGTEQDWFGMLMPIAFESRRFIVKATERPEVKV